MFLNTVESQAGLPPDSRGSPSSRSLGEQRDPAKSTFNRAAGKLCLAGLPTKVLGAAMANSQGNYSSVYSILTVIKERRRRPLLWDRLSDRLGNFLLHWMKNSCNGINSPQPA